MIKFDLQTSSGGSRVGAGWLPSQSGTGATFREVPHRIRGQGKPSRGGQWLIDDIFCDYSLCWVVGLIKQFSNLKKFLYSFFVLHAEMGEKLVFLVKMIILAYFSSFRLFDWNWFCLQFYINYKWIMILASAFLLVHDISVWFFWNDVLLY